MTPKIEADFKVSEQKDLRTELLDLLPIDIASFSDSSGELIKVLNPEVENENTYLFIFKSGTLPKNNQLFTPFLDKSSKAFGKVSYISCPIPEGDKIYLFSQLILEELEKKRLKRITPVGFYDGASLVQSLTIICPRLFRRAILINPSSRVRPNLFTRFLDFIEKFLPIGLPFKASGKMFDSRPFLHRIRCPIIVAIEPDSNLYNIKQSEYIAEKIPNCYLTKTKSRIYSDSNNRFSDEFMQLLENFKDCPTKRPQKNMRGRS